MSLRGIYIAHKYMNDRGLVHESANTWKLQAKRVSSGQIWNAKTIESKERTVQATGGQRVRVALRSTQFPENRHTRTHTSIQCEGKTVEEAGMRGAYNIQPIIVLISRNVCIATRLDIYIPLQQTSVGHGRGWYTSTKTLQGLVGNRTRVGHFDPRE